MGVVYEAYDSHSQQTVALKTLLHAEPSALYRFKNEFRSLADLAHPNLVCLFELFIETDLCFFTMEMIDGVDFVSYARGELIPGTGAPTLDEDAPLIPQNTEPAPVREPAARVDFDRLWGALRQLAEALGALHEREKLHRDIKPSNILVSRAGRVVVLDFGLATEMTYSHESAMTGFVGTPAYSSPEQANGDVLSPASDWYGVGVTLYEALTGKLPFEGNYLEITAKKQRGDPVPPSKLAHDVPRDLEELCLALLQPHPAARPSGSEILGKLKARNIPLPSARAAREKAGFVGREEQLSKLWGAFRSVKEGATVRVFVHGCSGMGKSTLVRTFVRQLEDREQVLAVAGRCYESESIPYKALDGVVDSLTRYLVLLPTAQAQALLPRDVAAIAKMFPVLARVEAIAGYRSPVRDIPDPLTLRRRAIAALRDLLGRIGDRAPMVLFIDDLHWSDSDSITLLDNLLRPPDAPRLLLIATFRTEEIPKLAFLQSLLREVDDERCLAISVEGLSSSEAGKLTRSLVTSQALVTDEFIAKIESEAQGNPFLIEQLARWATGGGEAESYNVSLAEMLESNMRKLPDGARNILETLSIAARPIPAAVALRASGVQKNAQSVIAFLRSANFLRSGTAQPLELYHDRIREGIASRLSPAEVERIHQKLAESLVAAGFDDPEVLFEHHYGARQFEPAARYARLAAAKASAALAFDRAAAFCRRALELVAPGSDDVTPLKRDLGQALANAGRPVEAARAYLDAAQRGDPATALDLQRRAAEQLLVGGHVDEGLQVIRTVLDSVGLQLAPGPKSALFSLLWRRFALWVRGLHFTETPVAEIPQSRLLHIDVCWTVAVGLAMVDNIRGADFQTRHLLLALRAGEPYRIARALAMEAGFSALSGGAGRQRSGRFSDMAAKLSSRVGNPHALGITTLMAGLGKFLVGEWRDAFEQCEAAYEILHDQCTGVLWEMTTAQNFIVGSLLYLGRFPEIARRLPVMLATAGERGNLYATRDIKIRMNFMWLVGDDPEAARKDLAEALGLWSHEGFYLQHYNTLLSEVQIALYAGEAETAWEQVTSRWIDLRRSMLLRIQVLRIEALFLRARGALAMAERDPVRRARFLKEAERLAGAIESEDMPWSDPFAWLLRAGVAALRNDRAGAEDLLSRAAIGFDKSGMALHAAVARYRIAELRGEADNGEYGQAARSMRDLGIKNPQAMLRTLAPGFRRPDERFDNAGAAASRE